MNYITDKLKKFSSHVYGYYRKSSNGMTVAENNIEALCKANNKILDDLFCDEGYSSKTLNRPNLNHILYDLHDKDIIMNTIKDVSTDTLNTLTVERLMRKQNRNIYFIMEDVTLEEIIPWVEKNNTHYISSKEKDDFEIGI